MPQKFTPDSLLALLYNETTPEEKFRILSEVQESPKLSEELTELSEAIDLLSQAELDPHPTSVAIIMEYSARTHEVQHA